MSSNTTVTEQAIDAKDGAGPGLAVLVMSLEAFASLPLPGSGSVVIGRSGECDLSIEDALASRRHARLHLSPALQIEDLGSANGTRLRDQLIPVGVAVPLAVGETIGIGSTLLVVQPARGTSGIRRVWSHRWFEARLQEECARAGKQGGRFALVRIGLLTPVPWSQVVPAIDRDTPPPNIFAAYGPYDYELLIASAGIEEATAAVVRIQASLAAVNATLRVGIACYPRDGRTADALMGAANGRLHPQELPPAADAVIVGLAGEPSAAMQPVHDLAQRAARHNISVLIVGETGVGKEVLAQALHRLSSRARPARLARSTAPPSPRRWSRASCSATRRAPSPAPSQAKRGLFEAANGGTAVPRRDRRDAAGDPGQAAAGHRGAQIRRSAATRDAHASTCASSPPPTATSTPRCGGALPRGSLLPPQRRSRVVDPAAARAAARDRRLLARELLDAARRRWAGSRAACRTAPPSCWPSTTGPATSAS